MYAVEVEGVYDGATGASVPGIADFAVEVLAEYVGGAEGVGAVGEKGVSDPGVANVDGG